MTYQARKLGTAALATGVLFLSACSGTTSDPNANTVSPTNAPTTTAVPTTAPPAAPETLNWDVFPMPTNDVVYDSDLTGDYTPEMLDTLETDANALTNMFNTGFFTDFTNPETPLSESSVDFQQGLMLSMQEYFTDEAFTEFQDDFYKGFIGGDVDAAANFWGMLPLTRADGKEDVAGTLYTLDNSAGTTIAMTDITDQPIIIELVDGNVAYSRYIVTYYHFADGQKKFYYVDNMFTLFLVPGANDKWVISGWKRDPISQGWVE